MEVSLTVITLSAVAASCGIALLFVGVLIALLIALGNKQYIFGIFIFLIFPVAFVYCLLEKERSAYAGKLLLGGLVLFLIGFGCLWWELTSAGMDFFDVLASTRPKH